MTLLAPPARALAQLDDPAFLRVVAKSLLWTLATFAAVLALTVWGSESLAASQWVATWPRWLAGLLGGIGAAVAAAYLFVPAATVVASLFAGEVSDAVERRFYPGLPPAEGAPFAEQIWDGVALGVRVLLWQTIGLVLALVVPGLGALVGWAIAAWAIGRGLFVAVAMLRMSRPEATALYHRYRLPVLVQGALIAAASLVPVLNLAVPVLGTAAMVHILHLARAR